MSDLVTNLRDFLSKNFRLDESELGDDAALFSDGVLDSFAMVEVVAFLEQESGSRIKAKDLTLENFDSISKIASYMSRR